MSLNRMIIIIFLVLIVFNNQICFANEHIKIKLVKILDGDTIIGKIDKNEFSIRLIGIDCYETSKINRAYKQAYNDNLTIEEVITKGNEAKKYLNEIYKKSNKKTYLDFKGLDVYKRVLGVVYFDKLNINEDLKTKNYCNEYKLSEQILLTPFGLIAKFGSGNFKK